jgi:osmotically inducible protein OsmC
MTKEILRKAGAVWEGDLRNGAGFISTESLALNEQPYSFETRFEDQPGTNPEELIAAAHAACYSMAFASTLKKKGYSPGRLDTDAVCKMVPKEGGGFGIKEMHLRVRGKVAGIDDGQFKQIARQADKSCPVSNLLRDGLEIHLDVELA